MNEYIPVAIERDLGVIDREDGLISGDTFGIDGGKETGVTFGGTHGGWGGINKEYAI